MSQPAAAEPQPKSKPHRPVWEKLLVRGGILVLLVLVGIEAAARHYHSESLTRMETAVRSSRQQSETILMDRQGLVGIPSGWHFETLEKDSSSEILTWKWPSLFKSYLLQVRINRDGKVQEYSTTGDLGIMSQSNQLPRMRVPMPPDGSVVVQVPEEPGMVLSREVIRQAFLMAAQEGFQLATPDAFERLTLPKGQADRGPFEVNVIVAPMNRITAQISRFTPSGLQSLYAEHYTAPVDQQLETLTALAERGLRVDFPKLLQTEGFTPVPATALIPARPVVQNVIDLQANPDPISQFAALRRLHQQVMRETASPEVYVALARGYATLGSDCELNWTSLHKVFKARALLWAERAVHAWPEHHDVWLARAQVRAICGLPGQALSDLTRYEEAASPGENPTLTALRQFCKWDAKGLAATAQGGDRYANFLYLRMLEQSANSQGWLKLSEKIARSQPTAWRVHALRATAPPLGIRHETAVTGLAQLSATLPVLMQACDDLPENVRQILRAQRAQQRQPNALNQLLENVVFPNASDWRDQMVEALLTPPPKPAVEPLPWSALGRMIDDFQFQQAMSLLEFHRLKLGVETQGTINQLRPLVRNHPLAGMLDCFDTNLDRSRKAAEDLGATLETADLSEAALLSQGLIAYAPALDKVPKRVRGQRDNVVPDLLAALVTPQELQDSQSWRALEALKLIQPDCPVIGAAEVTLHWERIEAEAPAWEAKNLDEPTVMQALTQQYVNDKRWTDARRTAERFAKLQPEYASYWTLADVCRRTRDWEGQQQALQGILALPSQGLEHAMANSALAYGFMDRHDWKAARPFAEAAAKSYSGWGLTCAADCYEGLKLWKQAERMMMACSQRYDNSKEEWYRWCLRTGHGDAETARRLAWEKFDGPTLENEEHRQLEQGVYLWMEGDRQEAYQRILACCERSEETYYDMLAIIFADQMGDVAGRDARLNELAAKPGWPMYTSLAQMILRARRTPDIVFTDAELEWFATLEYSVGGPTNGQYALAHALRMMGDPRSRDWLRRCASSPQRQKFVVMLAGWELTQAGEESPPRSPTELPREQHQSFLRLVEAFPRINQQHPRKGLKSLQAAAEMAPGFLAPLSVLGEHAFSMHEFAIAEEAFTKLIAATPQIPAHYSTLGRVYEAQNQPAKAIATYEAGLKQDSTDKAIHNNLAWLLLGSRDGDVRDLPRGLEHGRLSLGGGPESQPREVALQAVMAAAEGKFDEAIKLQQKALELAANNDKFTMQQRLKLFEKHQPYRRAPAQLPLLTVLPEDGSWVQFDVLLKVTQHAYWNGALTGRDTSPVEYNGSITVRSVGRIAAGNLRCLEIEVTGDSQHLRPSIYRLIIPEAAFGTHQVPIDAIVRWWSGLPNGPVLPLTDLSDEPDFAFLMHGGMYNNGIWTDPQSISTPKGPFTCEIISGHSHRNLEPQSDSLHTTLHRNADVPFGLVMAELRYQGEEEIHATLTLRDFGNNATAAWPDLVP